MKLHASKHRIDLKSNSWGLILFGGVFAGFGLLFVALLLTGGEVDVNGRAGTPADAWMPGIFVLVGLGVAGVRYNTWIDVRQRVHYTRKGWLFWTWLGREHLGEPSAVILAKEKRQSGDNTVIAFPIYLESATGRHELSDSTHELSARRGAEEVARCFHIPLHDTREGEMLVRSVEELDRSVVDDLDPTELGAQRMIDSQVDVRREGRTLYIRLRRTLAYWLGTAALVGYVGLVTSLWYFWWFRLSNPRDPDFAMHLFLYFPLVVTTVPVLALALGGGWFRRRIVASHEVLRAGGHRLRAAEVEELHVVSGSLFKQHLRIATDHKIVRIGRGLSDEDLRFLRAQILRGLRG